MIDFVFCLWGVGGASRNLMLSLNLLKSKFPMLWGGGALMEFDAEFKFAKIQISYVVGWGWGGGGSRNLMLSSNLLKIQNSYVESGGEGVLVEPTFNF